jgi:protein-L-isoaspartate(D-aspartate) O-methyltransferase
LPERIKFKTGDMANFQADRETMVETQIKARGIRNEQVLKAMNKVPRHKFVPEAMRKYAYNDEPLPIGKGQTISQPYIVAYMTDVLDLTERDRVLEIGTGSGYQAAVLAEIVREVYTVEIVEELIRKAKNILNEEGYVNVRFHTGDGTFGWKEYAPYDAIIVTAAPPKIPDRLQEQLKINGRMIVPVGDTFQELILIIRGKKKFKTKKLLPVRFVPLVSPH